MAIEIQGLKEYGSVRDAYDRLNEILEEAEKLRTYIASHKEGAAFVKAEEGKKFDNTTQRLETILNEEDPKIYRVKEWSNQHHLLNVIFIPSMELCIDIGLRLSPRAEINRSNSFSKIDYSRADSQRGVEQRQDIGEEEICFITRLGKGISGKIMQYARHKQDIEEIKSLEMYDFVRKEIKEVLNC